MEWEDWEELGPQDWDEAENLVDRDSRRFALEPRSGAKLSDQRVEVSEKGKARRGGRAR